MKVVLDSNVYISALSLPGGVAEQALDMAMDGVFEVALSQPILGEVLRVLSRKFRRDPEDVARTAIHLCSLAVMVGTTSRVSVLADDADNRVLECARAAGAGAIVTGDRAILALGAWEGIEILSLRQFIDRFVGAMHQPRASYLVAANDSTHTLGAAEMSFLEKLLRKRSSAAKGRRRAV